jgi:hypothetical protein
MLSGNTMQFAGVLMGWTKSIDQDEFFLELTVTN